MFQYVSLQIDLIKLLLHFFEKKEVQSFTILKIFRQMLTSFMLLNSDWLFVIFNHQYHLLPIFLNG